MPAPPADWSTRANSVVRLAEAADDPIRVRADLTRPFVFVALSRLSRSAQASLSLSSPLLVDERSSGFGLPARNL